MFRLASTFLKSNGLRTTHGLRNQIQYNSRSYCTRKIKGIDDHSEEEYFAEYSDDGGSKKAKKIDIEIESDVYDDKLVSPTRKPLTSSRHFGYKSQPNPRKLESMGFTDGDKVQEESLDEEIDDDELDEADLSDSDVIPKKFSSRHDLLKFDGPGYNAIHFGPQFLNPDELCDEPESIPNLEKKILIDGEGNHVGNYGQYKRQMDGEVELKTRNIASKERSKHVDKILEKKNDDDYLPYYDPKYQEKRMTEKSSTFVDIIRMAPDPKIDVPLNFEVEHTKEFDRTLLRLIELGELVKAREYFYNVTQRPGNPSSVSSYNIMMASFLNANMLSDTTTFFNLLQQSEVEPDVTTYNILISGCAKHSSEWKAKEFLKEMESKGITPNQQTREYMISLYLKGGDIPSALSLLEECQNENVSDYIPGLFARAHCEAKNYEEMEKFLWEKGVTPSLHVCNQIALHYSEHGELQRLDKFMETLELKNLKLSWDVSKKVANTFKDKRFNSVLNDDTERLIARLTLAPTNEERMHMIKESIINEREEEVVFRRRKKSVPIWKRKVEFKNPADTAWDTLIQEYLAVAFQEQNIIKSKAKEYKARTDLSRSPSKDNKEERQASREFKDRIKWPL